MVIGLLVDRLAAGHARHRVIHGGEIIRWRAVARNDEYAVHNEQYGHGPSGNIDSGIHGPLVYVLAVAGLPQKHRAIRIGRDIFQLHAAVGMLALKSSHRSLYAGRQMRIQGQIHLVNRIGVYQLPNHSWTAFT